MPTFDLNNIADYVSHNSEELLAKASLDGTTMREVTIQTGVKFKDALSIIDVEAGLQADTCGFSASGSTDLSERIITVGAIKSNLAWCSKELNKKWMNYKLTTRAGADVLPFEQNLIDNAVKSIAHKNEKGLWQGDTASTNAELKLYDGLLKYIKAESTAVVLAKAFATNAIAVVDAVANAIPNEIVANGDAVIYMPIGHFRTYQDALVKANMYHYSGEQTGTFEIMKPGSNIKVKGMLGLEGTKTIVGCNPKNLIVGCDLVNDEEIVDFYFDKSSGEHRFDVRFKLGTQIAFPSEIVYWVEA